VRAPSEPGTAPTGPRAWVLNLDAEVELAARGAYRANARMRALLSGLRPLAARALLEPGDLCVDGLFERGESLEPEHRGVPGLAWCPTPTALARLVAVGATPSPAPPLEVLRAANSRAFAAGLGQELPGARLCATEEEVLGLLLAEPGRDFLAKRDLSAAGRGRRPLCGARLTAAELAWIRASLDGGPLQVEPWVEIQLEFGTHGALGAGGELRLGEPTVQEVDPAGIWSASRLARPGELSTAEREELLAEARRVGRALHDLGYHGPFGVDAYRWRDPALGLRLCRRSEVNARYSMGWRIGMGAGGSGIG
jgi:hypothetical protein